MTGRADIKLLVMDVDGTLTDGKIYMGPTGEVMKVFDIKDGYAIHEMLPKMGIEPMILTGRKSAIVEQRCEELGITRLYQGISDKLIVLKDVCANLGLSLANVAYVGDDLNDYDCMIAVKKASGITACPANAVDSIIRVASIVSSHNGGLGALRDIIEALDRCCDGNSA